MIRSALASPALLRNAAVVFVIVLAFFYASPSPQSSLVVIGGLLIAMLVVKEPMIGLVIVVVGMARLREGNFESFFSFIPGIKVAFITIMPTDLVLALTFVLSIHRLVKRGRRPAFLTPILILYLAVFLSNLVGMLTGQVTVDSFMSGFRNYLLGYFVYLAGLGAVDSRKKLYVVIATLLVLVTSGMVLQFLQLTGTYEEAPTAGVFTSVAGRPVQYTRTGVGYLLLFASMLCISQVVEGKKIAIFLLFGVLASASLLLTLVRQAMIMLATGLAAFLTVGSKSSRARATSGVLLILTILFAVLSGLSPQFQDVLGDDAVKTILDRGSMVMSGSSDPTIRGRLDQVPAIIETWLSAPFPLLGYGYSGPTGPGMAVDLGFWNTLLLLGPVGLVAVAVLWVKVALVAIRTAESVPRSVERASIVGGFSFWVAALAGYLMGLDFFTNPALEVPLAMLVIERAGIIGETQPRVGANGSAPIYGAGLSRSR